MKTISITKTQARRIILHAAGLSKRAQFGRGKEAVYKTIDELGFVQIDTNFVVERAHHHVMAARIPGYKQEWLEELQADGRIFEFWTSDAGFLPMRNFRYSLPVKESFLAKRKLLPQPEINVMNVVLDKISREGPKMAKDFENDRVTKSKGWWDWRPSKIALERLHLDGRLMTLRAKNFQKVYDLTENILPRGADIAMPSRDEFARHVILRSVKCLGIAAWREISWRARYAMFNDKTIKASFKSEIEKLVDTGELCLVEVPGARFGPHYTLPAYTKKKIALSGDTFILSPFDVLNVFRHRLKDFFDFDYQVECFVPEPKRKYGYFSLPILVGDKFIARMDSKSDRKQRILTVHNLHFETGKLTTKVIADLCDSIENFAKFNQCLTIDIKKSNDRKALKIIRERFS